jgi:hypothetical protein
MFLGVVLSPVQIVASKYLFGCLIVGSGKLNVFNDLKPDGGAYANGRWPKLPTK